MRLAIADPPYLGRATRWYGVEGRGISRGKGQPDQHPNAAEWDDPARHAQLVRDLDRDYDGWAIAAAAQTMAVYLNAAPDARVMVWHRENAPPSGARVRNVWEPVFVRIPSTRRGYAGGLTVPDVLRAGQGRGVTADKRFTGAKPHEWTHWVLLALGYDAAQDTVDDLFPGSGAVSAAVAQGVLL